MDKDEKEVLTFRDKLGKVLMSLGIMILMFAVAILLSWLLLVSLASDSRVDQTGIYKSLLIMIFAGIALIRLSFYTVKK